MADYSYTLDNPATGGSTGVSNGDLSAADAEIRKQFGTDIYFENDYRLTARGDFALLDGIANLRQAIYHRLITRPGEYKFVPEYGVGIQTYVKRKRTVTNKDLLTNNIREQLLRDKRIADVPQIVIEDIKDGIQVGIVVVAAGKALRFRPFQFTKDVTHG